MQKKIINIVIKTWYVLLGREANHSDKTDRHSQDSKRFLFALAEKKNIKLIHRWETF